MDRSVRSNLLIAANYLEHFSNDSLEKIKICILEQFGCQKESHFLCKALRSMDYFLTPESSMIIKNKAVEIAESQMMINNINDSNDKSNLTVYKYVEQQQNEDILSRLHNHIIDYLASFLTKKESVGLGYLNRRLFSESQKLSFLLGRINDDTLILREPNMNRLLWKNSSTFAYGLPNHLSLITKGFPTITQEIISRKPWFGRFFTRLNSLTCNATHINLIPFNIFCTYTDKNKLYFKNDQCRKCIKRIAINGCLDDDEGNKMYNQVGLACKKFIKNHNSYSQDGIRKFRKILQFSCNLNCIVKTSVEITSQKMLRLLLITFGNVSESIEIVGRTNDIPINNCDQFFAIFHRELKGLKFNINASINGGGKLIFSDKNENRKVKQHYQQLNPSLKKIGLIKTYKLGTLEVHMLHILDQFNLRKNVECYTLEFVEPISTDGYHDFFLDRASGALLDKVFLKDYRKHTLLKAIIIELRDNVRLHEFAMVLVYFKQNNETIFVKMKQRLKNFSHIEIKWNIINPWMDKDTGVEYNNIKNDTDINTLHYIFNGKKNKEYCIDDNIINIRKSDLVEGIVSFCAIYKNVACWLERIQQKYFGQECQMEQLLQRRVRFHV